MREAHDLIWLWWGDPTRVKAELPFVHRTTNPVDDGRTVRSQAELGAAAEGRSPSLELRFPGCWLLEISPTFKNFLAFIPVNEHCTRYYLRSYFRFRLRWLSRPLGWLMSLSNRFILNQDRRVVVTQTPAASSDAQGDQLIAADRAVAQFRRFHATLLNRA